MLLSFLRKEIGGLAQTIKLFFKRKAKIRYLMGIKSPDVTDGVRFEDVKFPGRNFANDVESQQGMIGKGRRRRFSQPDDFLVIIEAHPGAAGAGDDARLRDEVVLCDMDASCKPGAVRTKEEKVGSSAYFAPEVARLAAHPGIVVVANPPDLRPHYEWADLAVVPIAAGGGTRIKLLEAFAHGVPVVATTIGAEGIAAEHGAHLVIADAPEGFAAACCRVLSDPALAARLAAAARQLVEAAYSHPCGVRLIRAAFAPAAGG